VTVKYALFDLDDTLVSTGEPFHEFVREFAIRYGLIDPDAVDEAAVAALRDRIEPISWRAFADKAEEWYGIATPPDELLAWVLTAYPVKFVLDASVAKGLVVLRDQGWKLGIVTNGTTAVQQAKIETVGLRRYVDFVIDSEAAGVRKPERRIFEVAAEGLGVELGPHGWMVGDNHANDIVGGHEAGLRTIWLPYGREQPAGAVRADHDCATVLEAMEIIAASRPRE
jgi:HAD superfamily hydrolase (TIGR01549 family)